MICTSVGAYCIRPLSHRPKYTNTERTGNSTSRRRIMNFAFGM